MPDERGFFSEALREDWKELLGEDGLLKSISHVVIQV
jgi:dTDP-4-dehydrorhamnose 3,5-epimerase-like enzyme